MKTDMTPLPQHLRDLFDGIPSERHVVRTLHSGGRIFVSAWQHTLAIALDKVECWHRGKREVQVLTEQAVQSMLTVCAIGEVGKVYEPHDSNGNADPSDVRLVLDARTMRHLTRVLSVRARLRSEGGAAAI